MTTHFTKTWSKALGVDLDNLKIDNPLISKLSQNFCDFIYLQNASSVLDQVNKTMAGFTYGEDIKLKLKSPDQIVVNDETSMAYDSFLGQVKDAVSDKWPEAWGEDLGQPLALFVSYTYAMKALSTKNALQWEPAVSGMVSTYIKTHGIETFRAHVNEVGQLLPQTILGVATTLTDPTEAANKFAQKVALLDRSTQPDPLTFIDLLIEHSDAPELKL